MANILSSLAAALPGGAAIVHTAGEAGAAQPVPIAAFQNADVLIVAVPRQASAAAETIGITARRPARPAPASGWAQPVVSLSTTPKTTAAKTTTTKSSASASGTAAKSNDPLAFLSDSKMSVEEKLFRFLCWISDKHEKELLKKMDEIYAKQKKSSSSGGKGLLGTFGSVAKSLGGLVAKGALGLVPGVGPALLAAGLAGDLLNTSGGKGLLGQISGQTLALGGSLLGAPGLAPALMKVASAVVDAAAGGGGGGSGSSAPESGSTTRAKDGTISQTDMMELQWLQEKQKEAFGTISNTLKAMHDTKMMVINNLRA